MKVLHITVRADIGGGPEHIFQLISSLNKCCLQYVACPPDKPYHDRFCDVVGKDNLLLIPHRRFELRSLWRVAEFVRAQNIQIVHSHGKGAGAYGRLLALMTKASSVHTFHGVHTGGYSSIKKNLYCIYERTLAIQTAQGIAVSKGEHREILGARMFPENRLSIVPNGVALGESPHLSNAGHHRLNVVAVNRFDFQKNAATLIDIVQALEYLLPAIDWHLTIYGDGENRPDIQARINKEKLSARVSLAGSIDSMRPALRNADVFLSSSRWEGLPIAILEAMSEGLPVVASDVVGNNDLVSNGVNGYLYALDKPADAAKRIVELQDGSLREQLGIAARNMVEADYSVEAMAAATLQIYHGAIHDPKRA